MSEPPPDEKSKPSDLLDPAQTFPALCKDLDIDPRLSKSLYRLNYTHPTLIQSKSLPLSISSGRDILLRARTGSGKTLAYTLPILQKILSRSSSSPNDDDDNKLRAVILVPTRELCRQVHDVIKELTYYAPEIDFVSLAGAGDDGSGDEKAAQEAMLRDGPDGIVATPAGLLAHVRAGRGGRDGDCCLDLSGVESLVVDEADLVLSFGYQNDINDILKSLPKIYQGFLMSATLSPEVESLKRIVLHSPAVLKLEEEEETTKGNDGLSQFYLALPNTRFEKVLVLYTFLKLGLLRGKGLFFVNKTDNAYKLKLILEQFHIPSAVLNSELPLKSRLSIIDQFNIGNFDYLIATDEGTTQPHHKSSKSKNKHDAEYGVSRGLDFRGVSFVVNVDFPPSVESYTHRIGRTARGGAKGVALSLVELETEDEDLLIAVQKSQPVLSATMQPQPSPLEFDLNEVEGFRYRVEDVSRCVTRVAIAETRAAEIKAEILNSQVLEKHFEEKPADLAGLMHVRKATHVRQAQEHLKHVPGYLLPRGMQVQDHKKKKRKRKRNVGDRGKGGKDGQKGGSDPLQTFEGDNLDDFLDEDDDDEDEAAGSKIKDESKVYLSTRDGLGSSNSNRNKWKERHKRGKFSKKYQKKQQAAF